MAIAGQVTASDISKAKSLGLSFNEFTAPPKAYAISKGYDIKISVTASVANGDASFLD